MNEAFLLAVGAVCLKLNWFAYSPSRCVLDATIVSTKARIVGKRAPKINCK